MIPRTLSVCLYFVRQQLHAHRGDKRQCFNPTITSFCHLQLLSCQRGHQQNNSSRSGVEARSDKLTEIMSACGWDQEMPLESLETRLALWIRGRNGNKNQELKNELLSVGLKQTHVFFAVRPNSWPVGGAVVTLSWCGELVAWTAARVHHAGIKNCCQTRLGNLGNILTHHLPKQIVADR